LKWLVSSVSLKSFGKYWFEGNMEYVVSLVSFSSCNLLRMLPPFSRMIIARVVLVSLVSLALIVEIGLFCKWELYVIVENSYIVNYCGELKRYNTKHNKYGKSWFKCDHYGFPLVYDYDLYGQIVC